MWESPILITTTDEIIQNIANEQDKYIIKSVQRIGINIDKDELLKALNYDRDQYEKGFSDGRSSRDSEIVRCQDCKLLSDDRIAPDWNRICCLYHVGKAPNGFCDECVRKDTEDGEIH